MPVVGSISKLTNGVSPAEDAGLLRNDRIVSIAGHPVVEFADLRAVVKSNPNVALPMVVDRKVNGTTQRLSLTITPADRGAAGGFLGIGPTAVKQTVNPIAATGRSITDFGSLFKSSVKAIVGIFSPHGFVGIADNVRGDTTTANAQGSRFLSPIGLVNVAGQTADQGLAYVFSLLVLLNIFVGLFNMLPLLPFDGGHVVLAIYEGIRSKIAGRRYYADAAKLLPVAYATVLFLLFIGVSSIWVDLRHPLKL